MTLKTDIFVVKNRETIDDVSVAIGFTAAYIPPTEGNTIYAFIQAIDGDVRICIDGTTPTPDRGISITEGSSIEIWGATALRNFLAIDDGGLAKLEVVYHGQGA